jgi:protein subunit release factor B
MPEKRFPHTTLNECDLEESFSHASGPGGQNVNKVATRVTLRHRPTGTTVVVQEHRTQAGNRELARIRLAQKITKARDEKRRAKIQAREKQKRQNRKRPAAVKRAFRESKRRRAETKRGRSRVQGE